VSIDDGCDCAMVTIGSGLIVLAVGVEIEDEPREALVMTPAQARQLGRQLREAAATAAAPTASTGRRRGHP
jgi:hypothetical protein